jgi:hypothetical protein
MKITRAHRWSALAAVAGLLTLFAWAASSPVGSGPDDDFHNASIWCGQGIREGLCEQGSEPTTFLVPGTLITNSSCFASQPDNSGVCQENENLLETSRVNLVGAVYPPVYYWTMSWLAGSDVVSSIVSMRIFNSILAVSLLLITVVALPKHLKRIPLLGYLGTAIPLGIFLTASINPSGWTYTSVLIFFASMLGFFTTTERVKRVFFAAMSSISFVMGAGTREDTPAYLLLSGAVAWYLSDSKRNSVRTRIIFGTATAIGVVIFSFVAFSSQSFIGYFLRGFDWYGGGTTLGGTFKNVVTLPDLWVGSFGTWGLGWLDTPMPSSVWFVTFGIYFALVFGSVRNFSRKQSIAVVIVIFALTFIPLYTLAVNGLLVGQIVQPRYLLPLLALLLAAAVYRSSVDSGFVLSRGQMWTIAGGLFAAHLISLHTNLRRYLTGLDENQVSLNFKMEWWWFERPLSDTVLWLSPNYVWLGGSLAFGVLLVSIWKLRSDLGFLTSAEQFRDREHVKNAEVN